MPLGRRLYPAEDAQIPFMQPGDYCRFAGEWWVAPPATGFPVGRLSNHTVTEHEDSTITVSPSILMTGSHGKIWHGYLTKGEWKEV